MPIILQRVVRLELINLQTGVSSAEVVLVSTASTANPQGRCVYSDGVNVYASYTNGSIEQLSTLTPNGNTFVTKSTVTPPILIADAKFDGAFFWALDATNVYQATDPGFTNIVKQWAHGVSGAASLLLKDNIVMVQGN